MKETSHQNKPAQALHQCKFKEKNCLSTSPHMKCFASLHLPPPFSPHPLPFSCHLWLVLFPVCKAMSKCTSQLNLDRRQMVTLYDLMHFHFSSLNWLIGVSHYGQHFCAYRCYIPEGLNLCTFQIRTVSRAKLVQ